MQELGSNPMRDKREHCRAISQTGITGGAFELGSEKQESGRREDAGVCGKSRQRSVWAAREGTDGGWWGGGTWRRVWGHGGELQTYSEASRQ